MFQISAPLPYNGNVHIILCSSFVWISNQFQSVQNVMFNSFVFDNFK